MRSFHLDTNSSSSESLRYVCKASVSTGPTIYWRVYHADQAQWEDLGPSSGPGVDITPTSLSTCVLQSVLVMDRPRGLSSGGDIISCTATNGLDTSSLYLQKGETLSQGSALKPHFESPRWRTFKTKHEHFREQIVEKRHEKETSERVMDEGII